MNSICRAALQWLWISNWRTRTGLFISVFSAIGRVRQGNHRPQTPPWRCQLGSYFKRRKTSPVRPSVGLQRLSGYTNMTMMMMMMTCFERRQADTRAACYLFMMTSWTSTSSRSLWRKSDMKLDTDSYVMCPHSTMCLHAVQARTHART